MARDFEDHCWKDVVTPEILETYKPYRREMRFGSRPAVLAIDLYNIVFRGGPKPPHEIIAQYPSTCGVYAWNAIEPIQKLLAAARHAQLPIFYTTSIRRSNKVRATNRQSGVVLEDDDFAIHEAFRPQEGDIVFPKERASGFFGTPLVPHLVRLGVDCLLVCGESTSGCVRASVVDAYSNGFHSVVVEECVFDRNPLSHKVNLFDLHHKYADVMTLEDVLERLRGLNRSSAAVA